MIDIALIAVFGAVTFLVANDGAWSAGNTFLCTLFAGLLAMNFFEPLSVLLQGAMPAQGYRMDMITLVGLFIAFVFLLRVLSEKLVPTYIQVPGFVDTAGRWLFGAAAGYVTMAFLLTALHTGPFPREFLGFKPERNNLFNQVAPDRQWLGFTQYVTEKAFARYDKFVGVGADGRQLPHAFDANFMQVGDAQTPYPNLIWPSFPMRYAQRRESFGGVARPAAVPAPVPVRPAPVPGVPAVPAGGGGGSTSF